MTNTATCRSSLPDEKPGISRTVRISAKQFGWLGVVTMGGAGVGRWTVVWRQRLGETAV